MTSALFYDQAYIDSYLTTNTKAIKTGVYVPSDGLTNYRAKLATAGSSLVKIAVAGDSVGWGLLTSNPRTKAWPALMAAALQALYGDGGSGFSGACNTVPFAVLQGFSSGVQTAYAAANNAFWALTGTWTIDGGLAGPGCTSVVSAANGDTATISNVRGTTIKIYRLDFGGAASFTYKIDAASAVTVNSSGSFQIQVTTITGLSAGNHTVLITNTGTSSAQLFLNGVAGYNASGVVVDNYSRVGVTSQAFSVTSGSTAAGSWSGGSANPCDLLIAATAANDCAGVGPGVVTLTSNATANGILAVSALVPPGYYCLDSEAIYVTVSSTTTAYYSSPSPTTHVSGTQLQIPTVTPDVWLANITSHFNDARGGSTQTGATDLAIMLPHIGKYDFWNFFTGIAARARGLAEGYGAALINQWAIGRSSWNYFNNLSYWGNSTTPSSSGTDSIHLDDAGQTAYWASMSPLLTALS